MEADDITVTESEKGIKRKRVKKGVISAHKVILAASSSVFKGMFFGPMKETKDVIEVKETMFEAFERLLEYIYQVDIECRNISLVELYEIMKLAELYDMPELMEELKIQIENFPISMDNLMQVATAAYEYPQFEDVSKAVMVSCAKFLFLHQTIAEQAEFLSQYASENGEVVLK